MLIRRPQAALYCQFAFQRNVVMINRVGNVALAATAFVHRATGTSVPLPRSVEVELLILLLAIVRNGMNMKEFSGM